MANHPVDIPDDVHERLEAMLPELGFESVSECVAFILRAVLAQREGDDDALHEDEEEEMRRRLADLGYV